MAIYCTVKCLLERTFQKLVGGLVQASPESGQGVPVLLLLYHIQLQSPCRFITFLSSCPSWKGRSLVPSRPPPGPPLIWPEHCTSLMCPQEEPFPSSLVILVALLWKPASFSLPGFRSRGALSLLTEFWEEGLALGRAVM